jgi:hypothetical protein
VTIKIEFADSRPSGDFALIIPSAGTKRPAVDLLGDKDKVEATLKRQRFEGESGGVADLHIDDDGTSRRLLVVGLGSDSSPAERAEKLGGTAVGEACSPPGETHAVIDLTGLDFDADAAARAGLAAALRSWRYDRYRTKLKDKQKPTLKTVTIVGGGKARPIAGRAGGSRSTKASISPAGLVTEPANIIYPESFVDRCRDLSKLGLEMEVLDGEQMKKLGMGALLGVGQGSVRDPRMLILRWNGGKPRRCSGRFRRQGRDLRYRRHLDQARPGHGSDEMGHGRSRRRRRRDEGAGASQGKGQRHRHLRPGREHAVRQRPAPGRRGDDDVRPDRRGHQYRRGRPSRPRRRDHLRPAQVRTRNDRRPRDSHRSDPHRAGS